MEESKKTENVTGMKEQGGSKIPKPGRFSVAKETRSKTSVDKKTIRSSKTKEVTKASSNLKQTQVTNLPKNVKRMSVAKISKDILNHFQDENLKSDDQDTEFTIGSKVLNNETAEKREPLKQKFSQVSQKQSGSLPRNPSAPDLKRCAAFGGIRFTSKGNTCRKFDMFQAMGKELKDHQAVNPTGSHSKELKRTTSAKTFGSKEIEWSNERNLEDPSTSPTESSNDKSCSKVLRRTTSNKTIGSREKMWSNDKNSDLPTVTTKSLKTTSVTVKETTLKKCKAFGGIRFSPKWQSTPLKPELFENISKGSKHDKKLFPQDSSPIWLENIPNSAKEDETITIDGTINIDETITLDETIQAATKEPKHVKPAFSTMKEISDIIFPAFAGMRLTPKRKSTHPKPDIFEKVQEHSKPNGQELHPPGTSTEEIKTFSSTTKTETQHSHVEMLEQTSTRKSQFKEMVSLTVKETNTQVAAFVGIRFAPKWESTPIRPNMFEGIQKGSKRESQPSDSSTKEMKTIPTTIIPKMKETQLSDDKTSALLRTQRLEPSKNEAAKKVIPSASGGIRFKSRQKNLHNIFKAQKS